MYSRFYEVRHVTVRFICQIMWGDLTFVGNFCELVFIGVETSFVLLYSLSDNLRVIMSRSLGGSGRLTRM